MRFIVTLYIFLGLSFLSLNAQVQYENLDGDLSALLAKIESKHHVIFSYDAEWVKQQTIHLKDGKYNLSQILNSISKSSLLEFEFIDGQNIIITKRKEEEEEEERLVCGYLIDEHSDEAIAFANIYSANKSTGTSSDLNGYFEISIKGEVEFTASYLGYKKLLIPMRATSNNDCPKYQMKRNSISFEPIILKEYLADGIQQSNLGNTVIISPKEMKTLPGSIDRDVLSSIQFIPGIQSPNESLDGIHIRGGTPDQNLFLWDDIPVYHTSHLFGSISAFNPFMIDKVEVYRSGIGSQFGGRVSGVVDMHTSDKITESFEGSAGFSLTHMYLNLASPLWKNSSIQFSIRRSITDAWNTPTFKSYAKKVFQGTKAEDNDFNQNIPFSDEFKFNDATFKWQYKLGKNRFVISSIGALNILDYTSEIPAFDAFSKDILNLDSRGIKIAWEKDWSDRLSSKLNLTSAFYNYDYSLSYQLVDSINVSSPPPIEVNSSNTVEDGGLLGEFNYQIDETQHLKAGFEFKENAIKFHFSERNQDQENKEELSFPNSLAIMFGAYSLNLPKVLQIDVGLRYQNHRIIQKNYFEPRIALSANINDNLKLKASTGKHFQFVSQLVTFDINDFGFNDPIWVASNDTIIPVIESNQWMVGIMYQKNKWTIDVEGYVKEISGISTLTRGFAEIGQQTFSIGDSRIRGLDVLIKRRVGKYKTWLSYTLSEALYEFRNISQERFPASHNRTHQLQWVNMYTQGNFEYSIGLQRGSSLPFTPALGINSRIGANGDLIESIDYGAINSSRLTPYFRLDASIVYNYTLGSRFKGYISFSIQNLSSHENLLERRYLLSEPIGQRQATILSNDELGLGFTPNLSVHLAW